MAALKENNYPKALTYSGLLMGIFLLISYFIVFGQPLSPQEVGTGGLIVNYGTSEEGMGSDYMSIEEPSVSPDANNALPDKVTTNEPQPNPSSQQSDKVVATQDNEDAPVVSNTGKKSDAPSTSNPNKQSTPTVNQNALYKGPKKDGTGQGDGTGSTPGNQGSPDGDPLSPNYGEGGSGFGNIRLSLANRRFVSLPRVEDDGQSSGYIAVEIRVDKTGTVVYARAGAKGTTLSDLRLWNKVQTAVLGAKLNQLDSAPDVQIGVVMFHFKVR